MGDPRNWTDRKVEAVRAANAAADRATLAECELFNHGPALEAGMLSPCTVMNHLHFSVRSICAGCLRERVVTWREMAATRVSHEPWAKVMRQMVCEVCGSGPKELLFERAKAGGGGTERGALSRTAPHPRAHLF